MPSAVSVCETPRLEMGGGAVSKGENLIKESFAVTAQDGHQGDNYEHDAEQNSRRQRVE